MTYCQSINPDFENYVGQMSSAELEIKTRQRATPLLPTWIYSCRSEGTVSCALPFTTNVTISTSISKTFRSWAATFHLRQPMAFLSQSSYGIPGLTLLLNVLFEGLYDFHLSSSERICQGTFENVPGGYWVLTRHYEVPLSQMLHDILGHSHLQWHPQLIRHFTNLWTYYQTGPYYRFWPYYQISWGFHRTLQRMRLLLRTPGPVPFGTCICSNVETILSCHIYGPFEYPSVLIFCFEDRMSSISNAQIDRDF